MSVDEISTRVRALLSNSQFKEAVQLIDKCGVDVKTSQSLWELKIIVFAKMGSHPQALAAAEEYVSTYDNFLNADVALSLGDGALGCNRYDSAYRWYKHGTSATTDKPLLRSLNGRLLLARSLCARKGTQGDFLLMLKILIHHKERKEAMDLIDSAQSLAHLSLKTHMKVFAMILFDEHDEAFRIARELVGDRSPEEVAVETGLLPHVMNSCTPVVLGDGFLKTHQYKDACRWYKLAGDLCKEKGDDESANRFHGLATRAYDRLLEEGLFDDKEARCEKSVAVDDSLPKDDSLPAQAREVGVEHAGDSSPKDDRADSCVEALAGEVDVERAVVTNRMFSSKLSLYIDATLTEDRVWVGYMENSFVTLPKTFIKPTSYQLENFKNLLSMREGNKSILSVDYIDNSETLKSQVIICDKVFTIDHFFREELESFKQRRRVSHARANKAWWDHIALKFNQIFRDVVRGLRLLFFSKRTCGDLINNIYVTVDARGKILPSLDPSTTETNDISALGRKMRSILLLPFEGQINPTGVPDELIHFLNFIHADKLWYVNAAWWLLDHPYFWTPKERYEFVNQLQHLMKRRVFHTMELNSLFITISKGRYGYLGHEAQTWHLKIADGVYKEIYNKGGRDSVPPYLIPIHIVRYMKASYEHQYDECPDVQPYFNERQYDECPDRVEGGDLVTYDRTQVEARLSNFFPEVYTDLFVSLYEYAKARGPEISKELSKGLWEISSRLDTKDGLKEVMADEH